MGVRRSGIVGSTLAVALLGAFFHHSVGSSGATPGAESKLPRRTPPGITEPAKKGTAKSKLSADAGKPETERQEGPWLALRQHFAGRPAYSSVRNRANSKPAGTAQTPDCSTETKENAFQPWCIPAGERVKALIAVVPDPVRTHMALRFDRAVDAIELAAASMDYLIDHYWLPWDLELKTDWDDYESFKNAKTDRKEKEKQPGLLLFRWKDNPEDNEMVLAVFLVSETATAGINGEQFANAVCYADLLNAGDLISRKRDPGARNHSCSSERVRRVSTYILGPTSSASFDSLDELVTSYQRKTFVIKDIAWGSSEAPLGQSFIRPVAEATQQFRDLLVNNGYIKEPCREDAKHEIAMLSEASTAFGASFGPKELKSYSCVDLFRYTREIASLRNAYGALSAQNTAALNPSAGPWPSLTVDLTDRTNRSDEPPDFSRPQSALSQEAMLMGFAAEMQRQHYSYIGINGSNPLDVVFLASFLRSAVPNARLFSFNSDRLMEHEPDNAPYIGTLSVAAYPLLYPPLNRVGEPGPAGKGTRLPFTSQGEEALYNAAVCLVRNMLQNDSLGYLSERGDCAEASNPPLWLTTFGAGGHWPIQVLGPGESETRGPDLANLALPSAWKATCSFLCAVAILHLLLLLGLARISPKFQAFKLTTVSPARQLFGIHMASATLALAMFLVALPAWKPNKWTHTAEVLAWILPAVCWALTTKYLCWWWRDRTTQREHYLRVRLSPAGVALRIAGFGIIWLAAGVLAYIWRTLRDDPGGHYGDFFSLRALNLASVVSPLAPMLPLLAAIYIAAIFYVWHLAFDDRIRPRLNPSWEPSGEDKLRPGWRNEKFIAGAVNGDLFNVVIGILILGFWLVAFHQPQFQLFERTGFQWLFAILFCLVILLILVSGFRLARIWERLQRFLLEINQQRARRVLLQLKDDGSSWASIWFYGSEDPDWDYMVRSVEVLQELRKTPGKPPDCGDIDTMVKMIRRAKRKLRDRSFFARAFDSVRIYKDGALENAISSAQDRFAELLNEILNSLQTIWDNPASSEDGIERQQLLEKYVALRWVAFIRGVIARIRLLILFLAVAFSLAMISLVIYSFEPHRELLWSVTAVFVTIGMIIMKVLIQMHRDPTLSRITNTKPGRLDATFFLHLLLGVGPLLTLLATYSPSIGRYILSFLQPGLEAVKH